LWPPSSSASPPAIYGLGVRVWGLGFQLGGLRHLSPLSLYRYFNPKPHTKNPQNVPILKVFETLSGAKSRTNLSFLHLIIPNSLDAAAKFCLLHHILLLAVYGSRFRNGGVRNLIWGLQDLDGEIRTLDAA